MISLKLYYYYFRGVKNFIIKNLKRNEASFEIFYIFQTLFFQKLINYLFIQQMFAKPAIHLW